MIVGGILSIVLYVLQIQKVHKDLGSSSVTQPIVSTAQPYMIELPKWEDSEAERQREEIKAKRLAELETKLAEEQQRKAEQERQRSKNIPIPFTESDFRSFTEEEWSEIESFFLKHGREASVSSTLLHNAAAKWGVAVVSFLISKGADVNARSDKNRYQGPAFPTTPTLSPPPVPIQPSRPQDELQDDYSIPPITITVKYTGTGVAPSAPSDIYRTPTNNTPLHVAAANNGNVEVAKYLVSKGAMINAKNSNANTPLDVTEEVGNTAVARYLSSIGGIRSSREIIMERIPMSPSPMPQERRNHRSAGSFGGMGGFGGGGW